MQTDWEHFTDNHINKHTTTMANKILELSKQCIPTITVTVKLNDTLWITKQTKQLIRNAKNKTIDAYKQTILYTG